MLSFSVALCSAQAESSCHQVVCHFCASYRKQYHPFCPQVALNGIHCSRNVSKTQIPEEVNQNVVSCYPRVVVVHFCVYHVLQYHKRTCANVGCEQNPHRDLLKTIAHQATVLPVHQDDSKNHDAQSSTPSIERVPYLHRVLCILVTPRVHTSNDCE